MVASLTGLESNLVEMRVAASGQISHVPLSNLSIPDQAYVQAWAALGFGVKPAPWPRDLRPMLNFTARALPSPKPGEWIYATPNYEYRCDVELAPSLIKEYSLVFESTYFALRNIPLGLNPKPAKERFVVRLFQTLDAYHAAGGMKGSGGVYMLKSQEILVPLEALGVRETGNKVAIDRRGFDAGNLIHEITHQVMHDWLDTLPVWFVEGMAEYMAAVPYDEARFDFYRAKEGVAAHLARKYGVEKSKDGLLHLDVASPKDLMDLTHRQWASEVTPGGNAGLNYRSAFLAVYFFLHLDGKGDSAPVVAYLRQAAAKKAEICDFLADYNEAVTDYNLSLRRYTEEINLYNGALAKMRTASSANTLVATPIPPVKPALPPILARNPGVSEPIDLMKEAEGSVKALWRNRSPKELWADMETAFAKQGIRMREVSGAPAAVGSLKAVPIK